VNGEETSGAFHRGIEFRYSLGDLCLFRVSFRALVVPHTFDPAAPPWSLPVEKPEFSKVDVIVYEAQHLRQRLAPVRASRSAICYFRDQTFNHYIDFSGTFDDYRSGFSSKTRSTLQRKLRKLSGMALECRAYSTPESVAEFHAMAREVAVKTYQEKLFGGAIPATSEFANRMRALAERDCLRGFILFINHKPVAYLYLPASGDTLTYGYLGYDPDHAALSPGTVLLYLALKQLFAEQRFRYLDFTYGKGQSKELFGRASFLHANIYLFRWTARNVMAVYGHAWLDWFSSKLGDILSRLGLREKVRRLIRGAA
jgi:CelD/BcsL family acetyltransferase involved in cellulose biosynthesis